MAAPTTDPPVRIITGNGDDMDASWLWFKANLAALPEAKRVETLRTTPALVVLLSYHNAVARSRALPDA